MQEGSLANLTWCVARRHRLEKDAYAWMLRKTNVETMAEHRDERRQEEGKEQKQAQTGCTPSDGKTRDHEADTHTHTEIPERKL